MVMLKTQKKVKKLAQKKLEKWRENNLQELVLELNDLKTEYMKLRSIVKSGGAIEKPGRIHIIKKQIARLLTIIKEKEISVDKK